MPALTPSIGNIGRSSYMWRAYQANGTVPADLKLFVPSGFEGGGSAHIAAVGGAGNLDLGKFKTFFTGSQMSIADLKAIRLRATAVGEPISENDVRAVFNAYCAQLDAKNIVYHYNADFSPFDVNFQNQSNCQGRAKGFLQAMAMLGVPKDQLNQVTIGGSNDPDKKICQKSDADIVTANLYVGPNAATDQKAPNAVRIKLKDGDLKIGRTAREPFANHYCAFLDVPGLGFKYWDPLLQSAYRNGFDDFFTSYAESDTLASDFPGLKSLGLKCLSNPDNPQERIYLLPPSSKVTAANKRLLNVVRTTTFREVEAALTDMSTENPQVAVLIDVADWNGQGGNHPPVIMTLFGG